jgi:integrase
MRQAFILYRRAVGGRGGRVYYAAFWNEERHDYMRRSTGQTSKAAADAQARKWLAEGLPLRDSQTFLGYLLGFWQTDSPYLQRKAARGRLLSAAYLRNGRSAIEQHVKPFLETCGKGRLPLSQATAGILEDLILHLRDKGLGSSRINGIYNAVAVPLAEAVRLGLLAHNPASRVERLPDRPPIREILSLGEVRTFFALSWQDPRLLAASLTAATTGLRLGEIRGLQTEDVQSGYLRVQHNWQDGEGLKPPKWGSKRDVPLPARTEAALHALIESNPWGDGFVFYGVRRGFPPDRKTITNAFTDGLLRIGISEEVRRRRGLTFHSWRHFYNSMLRGQLPDHALRALTGHRSEAMTERYTTLTEEQRKAAAVLSSRLFAPADELPGVDIEPAE